MYKPLVVSLVGLGIASVGLVRPSTAAAAMRSTCQLHFCEQTCPSNLATYCAANQTSPCPNPPYTTYLGGSCAANAAECGGATVVECDYR
jgi:hypothetical protein